MNDKENSEEVYTNAAAQLRRIQEALRRYHGALSARQHGGLAASRLVEEVEAILGMRWHQ